MHHPTPHNRIPLGLLAALGIALALPVLGLLAWLAYQWQTLDSAMPWLTMALRVAFFLVPPAYVLAFVWQRWGRTRYIDAAHVERLTRARVQIAPLATSFTYSPHSEKAAAQDTPQLPAPVALSSESEWLGWTDQAPHLMVAGRTDSGKTTTVEAVLARRILAGDLALVIDPHYQAGKWLGAAAIGGGRDYQACYQAFDAIRAMLDLRYQAYNAGTQTEQFKRVTIVVDEVPAIIAHAQGHSKALYERWLLFATSLGSEARKVRISIILLTQSPLVRDIGISSAMRDNFIRIALGDTAAELLREEPNAAHKQALLELLRGRPYPAAMEYRNNWYALRNDDIRQLTQTNGATPRVPSLLLASPVSGASGGTLAPTARVMVPPTAQLSATIPDQILLLLDGAGRYMTASEIASSLGIDLQVARVVIGDMHKAGQLSRRECQGRTTRERFEYQRLINKRPSGPLVVSA
jgi:hypothetical protein